MDDAAAAAGLRAGLAVADARAACPAVRLVAEDAAANAALLRRLGLWAMRFTPLAGVEAPEALLLDITGCAAGQGEPGLRDAAVGRLARLGVTAVGAVAGTAGAALALARAGAGVVVPAGREAAATDPLPLSVLPVEPSVRAALRRLGLWQVGAVRALPRAELAARFGAGLVTALDEVAGLRGRPIRPLRPPPDFTVARELLEPIVTREAVDAVFARLLEALCLRLAEAGRGARRVVLRAHGVDGGVQEVAVGTALPMRAPAHLERLFRERLERLAPGFGFDRLALSAEATDPLAAAQDGFAGGEGAEREALARLLDRLGDRLRVWRLDPRAAHLPEEAVAHGDPLGMARETPAHWHDRPRPVRLLSPPEPVEAIAPLPDGPPARLTWRGRALRVRAAEGPERLHPCGGPEAAAREFRDYFRVEVEGGERLWVCRVGRDVPMRWFLHGFLA
ncbi:DNA polymerase Y family protein [Roseomonas sp. OT10]|uniref:Y-family DNA polymerase n=1 Tax=Roseomonas cutis TaxID=2897332 RepID=UPI001E475480|nr:DNA polymerase Y family protein [Roseomonas sp. OT10]UFN47083.1 DNA polymerase Y family protein [Roseomonas sp. OT10]